jgi:N-formylglutamate amidohydrolase
MRIIDFPFELRRIGSKLGQSNSFNLLINSAQRKQFQPIVTVRLNIYSMVMAMHSDPSFIRIGPDLPRLPVILSVPHAGRSYPSGLALKTRARSPDFLLLEDRFADHLVMSAVEAGSAALIAQTPRLWIDLNRGRADIDPDMVDAPITASHPISIKARGGLGLIPRRTAGLGEIWRQRLSASELEQRIAVHHTPYHNALSNLLTATATRFGSVALLDIHSMPPLTVERGVRAPDVVIGDRFGRSAPNQLTERVAAVAAAQGLKVAVNSPYAGGYILERHGAPGLGRHAIQVEIDRRLYLDSDLRHLGPGLRAVQQLITEIVAAISDELTGAACAIAAE